MKLPMEYHNDYLEYMVQRDGWNVVSLNKYRGDSGNFWIILSMNKEV
jgi:hypothetical protein